MAEQEQLARLISFATPTIANALESLGMAPDAGYSDASIGLLTHGVPAFVGRAVTARLSTRKRADGSRPAIATETWWQHVAAAPRPSVVVAEDIDPIIDGAMWGEVMGRLHQALGVAGIVTNGAVRDIDELSRLGFPVLAGRACVSHAYAHFVELDVPVRLAGLLVEPGDLLHADQHGVQRIPSWVDLGELAEVADRIESLERELFAATSPLTGGLDDFLGTWRTVRARWPSAPEARSGEAI
jgi:regulator of RNase E activity RraA